MGLSTSIFQGILIVTIPLTVQSPVICRRRFTNYLSPNDVLYEM